MYVHPFDDTNPASDGKIYTRSYHRGGNSAIQMLAADMHVRDIYAGKTCVAAPINNDPVVNYVLHGQSSFGGTSLIEHCYLYYGSKHILGYTDGNSNSVVTTSNVQAEQGTPYASQNPFVSYNGGGSTLNNQHLYTNCTNLATSGLIGSTAGTNVPAGSLSRVGSFYSHNSGGTDQFSLIAFDGCDFIGTLTVGGSAATVTIDNTNYAGGGILAGTVAINRCLINGMMPFNSAGSQTFTMRNCIVTPSIQWGGGLNDTHDLYGTETIEGCTFDLSALPAVGGSSGGGLFKHGGNATLTFRNNAVIVPNNAAYGVFENLTTDDTVTATNNVYVVPGSVVSLAYNDGKATADRTFPQWQTLGFEANSRSVDDLLIDAAYRPLRFSPLISAGVNLGPMYDFYGLKVYSRDTVGAVQYAGAPYDRREGRLFPGPYR
jgi:hypothetical protein